MQKYKSKYSSNEKDLTSDTKLNINIFNWFYNTVFINNYTLRIYNEINSTADSLQGYILNQYNKYDNLANSSYVTKFIEDNEYGINDNNSSLLNNNVLYPLKEIKQMIIFNNNGKEIFNSKSDNSLRIDENYLLKLSTQDNEKIQIIKSDNNKNYFVFFIKKEKSLIYFIVSADYFNVFLEELNVKNNFLIFNKNYDILYSNSSDEKLIADISGKRNNNKILYNDHKYNFQFIKLSLLNLYCGVIYPIYPFWKTILNLLKDILILGVIYLLTLSIKLLYKRSVP